MSETQKPLFAVVDDAEDNRSWHRLLLERLGCLVLEFFSGEDFLANAGRDIDCVLMNEILTGMRGHQTFHEMRRMGWCIPVVSEQSRWWSESIWEAYGNGQVAHVSDSLEDFSEFDDAIRKALVAAGFCVPPKGGLHVNPDLLAWSNETIPKMARHISAERAFHYLSILADALEEGGCTDADILNHCRQPGEHLRGCWVLDRILLPAPAFDVIS